MTPERRAWPRADVAVPLSAVAEGSRPLAYVAENLSAGGALLLQGPPLSVSRDLKLMIPLRGRDLVLHARVTRVDRDPAGRVCAAVCFRGVPTFVQDLIQNHVLQTLAHPKVAARRARAVTRTSA
jgi:hypothetical protein